ncbi:MAG: DUF418 domain-containing protein [Phycisphaerales bacterium]
MNLEPEAGPDAPPAGESRPTDSTLGPALALSPTGPVAESNRLLGLDVARAVALLGIFFVNASIFGLPFASIMDPSAPPGEGPIGLTFYWFTMIFCAGKFYPLFSLLFGVGLAIMFTSNKARGRSFHAAFFRRLVMLAGFGIAHIALLWPGDILLIYAGVGLWMLLLGGLRPRALLVIAGVVFAIGVLLSCGFAMVTAVSPPPGEVAPRPMPPGDTPLEQWAGVFKDWNQNEPYDSRMIELESRILREGPFLAALAVRAFNYAFTMVYVILVMFWSVLACFCTGAALLKLGFFHGKCERLRTVFIGLGLGVGLPLNVLAAIGSQFHGESPWGLISTFGMQVGGPLMSLMYLSLIMKWAESGAASALAKTLANLGRMGLTGYLLESLLMSAVMAHWGLAKFGLTTWAERGALVIGIYLIILVIANVWMRAFAFGPLEWLWRSWTYLKIQPLSRRSAA